MDRFRGRTFPDSVAEKLDTLVSSGQVDSQELDEGAYDALKDLTEEGALTVLDQFLGCDLTHINNKSAYLCGIIKTHREKPMQDGMMNVSNEATTPVVEGAPNEEKIKELLNRTGYSLDITVGQRKYGGPPPGWDGPPPPTGASVSKIFVNKINFE